MSNPNESNSPADHEHRAGGGSAEAGLLSSATLERAAMALEYRMRNVAEAISEEEERRNYGIAAILREGAENDRKAFDEIQELRRRLDNARSAGGAESNQAPK